MTGRPHSLPVIFLAACLPEKFALGDTTVSKYYCAEVTSATKAERQSDKTKDGTAEKSYVPLVFRVRVVQL